MIDSAKDVAKYQGKKITIGGVKFTLVPVIYKGGANKYLSEQIDDRYLAITFQNPKKGYVIWATPYYYTSESMTGMFQPQRRPLQFSGFNSFSATTAKKILYIGEPKTCIKVYFNNTLASRSQFVGKPCFSGMFKSIEHYIDVVTQLAEPTIIELEGYKKKATHPMQILGMSSLDWDYY